MTYKVLFNIQLIMWYIKYFWVKLNILVLTPIVKVENLYKMYKKKRLEAYIKYVCTLDMINKAAN